MLIVTESSLTSMLAEAEKEPFELTDEKLLFTAQAIERLKDGQTITFEEAIALDSFLKFLDATVTPHQYTHQSIEQKVIEGWISELGLDREFPDYDWDEVLYDQALNPAFISVAMDKRNLPKMKEPPLPTPEQNKLAGRYMAAIGSLSGIFPFGAYSPHEVADRFYQFSQIWEQGEYIAQLPK
jgi:hypothetical protein